MNKIIKKISMVLAGACVVVSLFGASASAGTGPYRRVSSKVGTSSTPYTYVESKVTLPVAANVKEASGTNDTAYVYIGGSGNGTEIDAGLQHSPTYNNWAPIILCKGVVYHPTDKDRFVAGQNVTMAFYVSGDNKVTLKVTGKVTTGQTKTIVINCNNATGWKANGVGNSFKRVTSIGQAPQNLNNKSYIKNIRWYDSYIGTISKKHKWLAGDTLKYISYPSNSKKVTVNYVNAGEEVDTIDLTK